MALGAWWLGLTPEACPLCAFCAFDRRDTPDPSRVSVYGRTPGALRLWGARHARAKRTLSASKQGRNYFELSETEYPIGPGLAVLT